MHEIELRNSRNQSEREQSLEQFLNSEAVKEKQKAVLYIEPVRYEY